MPSASAVQCALLLLSLFAWSASGRSEVTTSLGKLLGFKQYVEDKKIVDTFLGVPYAQPPVKSLRFKPPVPAVSWAGERSAKYLPNTCLQVEPDQEGGTPLFNQALLTPPTPVSEDCLYLNVWAPRRASNTTLATLVWFHGGDFSLGSASSPITDGAFLAAKYQLVVVSVSYRLGAAGFLYTGSQRWDARGNMGLLDQRLALSWVADNVEQFGGDRNNVTLFGVDSGAASIGLHLLSPGSWPYFSRAILQSGSPLSSWALTSGDVMLRHSLELGSHAGCHDRDTERLVACLRRLDRARLQRAQRELLSSDVRGGRLPRFGPVLDKEFIGDDPRKLLAAGKTKPAALLMGINADDGLQTLISRFPKYFPAKDTPNKVTRDVFVNDVMATFLPEASPLQQRTLEYVYTNLGPCDDHGSQSYYNASIAFAADVMYKCDVIELAKSQCVSSDVFLYSFQRQISKAVFPTWDGAVQYGEVELLFGVPFRRSDLYSQQELILSTKMMELWTNFAKFGSPNAPDSSEVWPRYDLAAQRHLVMDTKQGLTTRAGLRQAQCSFLHDVFPLMKTNGTLNTCGCRTDSLTTGSDPAALDQPAGAETAGPPGNTAQSVGVSGATPSSAYTASLVYLPWVYVAVRGVL